MVIVGLPLEIAEIVTFVIGILRGTWLPFVAALAASLVCAVFLLDQWHKQIEYICPECHARFQPGKVEAFFANHTPKTRKLTCPDCRRKWIMEKRGETLSLTYDFNGGKYGLQIRPEMLRWFQGAPPGK